VYTDLHIRTEFKNKKSLRIAIPNNYWALIFFRSYIIQLSYLPYALLMTILFWNVEIAGRVYCNNIICKQTVFKNPNIVSVTMWPQCNCNQYCVPLVPCPNLIKTSKIDGTATFWWKTILECCRFPPGSFKIYSTHRFPIISMQDGVHKISSRTSKTY